MKKQAMFAKTRRLLQDEALPGSIGTNKSNRDDRKVNFSSDLTANRPPAAKCEPQIQQNMSEHTPRAVIVAPFLNHTVLTPAQKEFLYTAAASHSAAHVRRLITQHYLNVLHSCIQTDYNPKEEELVGVTDVKRHSEVSREKPKATINNRERIPGNYQSPNRRARISNTSASKQRKMKQFQHQRSPKRRATIRLFEEEEDEEKGLDDSL